MSDVVQQPAREGVSEALIEGLSREQLRFYALHQQRPGDPDLYVVRVLRLRGELEVPRLARAVAALIQRHDALRAVIPLVDGEPRLAMRAELPVPLCCLDATSAESADRVDRAIASERRADPPFDVERGPLFRLTLLREHAERHVLVLRFHHLICDGASVRRFCDEMWAHYRDHPATPAPALAPAPSFRDFARWEAARADHARTFWTARLADAPPLDFADLGEGEAATVHAELAPPLLAALRAFCRTERVTPYVVLTAVLARVLADQTEQRDFVIVTPLAARSRREFQATLGALIQWIALRPRLLPGQPFSALVAQLRGDLAAAYDHATSYEALLAAHPDPSPARRPRFHLTLNYAAERPIAAPPQLDVTWDPVASVRTAYDLALRFEELDGRCTLGLTYPTAALSADAAARFAADFLTSAARLFAHPEEPTRPSATARRAFVIAATFTASPLRPVLDYWLATLGLPYEPVFAPAGQLLQQLVDPRGLLAHNDLGANALLVRYDDWRDPAAAIAELRRLLVTHAERSPAPTLVVICPPRPERRAESPADFARFTAELVALGDDDRQAPGFSALAASRLTVVRWEDVLARYPVEDLDDAAGDAYAQAPYSAEFHVALGTELARQLCALTTPPPKVLALDCDGTLWRGVVGEDGPRGLVLDDSHRALQAIALERRAAGTLLCLASKNEAADVWSAFATVPGMTLRREHLAAHRIDWQPKSQNLAALAAQLQLGVDSILFLDDSPAECAEVRARCPAALTLELPGEEAARRRFLDHVWPLDARKRTDADRSRAAMVTAEASRRELRAQAPDLAQFLASLEVKLGFAPLSPATAARAAQLTQRTNQFNTTTLRRSEAELLSLPTAPILVEVSDRFGDYGVVGVLMARGGQDALVVDNWLISCRALGRGVEQQILVELGRRARAAGRARVDIAFTPTAKNRPAAQFLDAVAAAHRHGEGYAIPVEVALRASELARAAAADAADADAPAAVATAVALAAPAIPHQLWSTIATQLDTVAKIRRAMIRPRPRPTAFVAPRRADERTIASAWCAALHLRELGVDDDYFTVGGDSIRSLAVVAELRRAGLAVTPLELHQHPTVARLAAYLRTPTDAPAPAFGVALPAAIPTAIFDGEAFPLSTAQRKVVAIYARENLRAESPPSGVFHIQDRFLVEVRAAPLADAVSALRRAFADLLRCTAPLRSQIFAAADGQLWQRPRPFAQGDVLPLVSLPLLDEPLRPFDPARGDAPLLRAAIAITPARQLELLVTAHHGFCDGWSLHLAYSRLFALADAYLSGDLRRAATLCEALTISGDSFRQLVALEAAASDGEADSADDEAAPPLTGPADRLLARLDVAAFARVQARARDASVSIKAVVLAAFARALASRDRLDAATATVDTTTVATFAVVTNRRRAELAQPLDVFGLCWSFAPIAAATARGPIRALHQALLDPDAHRASHPAAALTQARAAYNFVHFHHARWRDGTPHFRVTQREPTHRFPFPLDLTARVDDSLTLELSWNATAQLERPAAAALLQRIVTALATATESENERENERENEP